MTTRGQKKGKGFADVRLGHGPDNIVFVVVVAVVVVVVVAVPSWCYTRMLRTNFDTLWICDKQWNGMQRTDILGTQRQSRAQLAFVALFFFFTLKARASAASRES